MNAITFLERCDGVRFQVTAGSSDGGLGLRHLTFSVPDTDDSLRVEWEATADISANGSIPVRLRVGTLPAFPAVLADHLIVPPAATPRFGPNVEAILSALAEAFGPFVRAGKVGRSTPAGAAVIDHYAEAGSCLGWRIAGTADGAAAGAAIGAVAGAAVHLAE